MTYIGFERGRKNFSQFVRPKGNGDNVTNRGPGVHLAYDSRRGASEPPGGTPPPSKLPLVIGLFVALVLACAVLIKVRQSPPIAAAIPAPVVAATPAPPAPPAPSAAVQLVPRAEPVSGPLTTTGEPMFSGRQYFVNMPDGRHLLVNYRGWVDHACNLPKQPVGGANNAAYTESATGHTWIFTVPAGASNVPRWIDP